MLKTEGQAASVRAFPGAPWVSKQTTSTIAKALQGGLLEERFTYVDDGVPVEILRTWSYDRFQTLTGSPKGTTSPSSRMSFRGHSRRTG